MTELSPAHRYTAAVLLGVSLILGAWLRLSGLDRRSITHPEMYVPGIPLPEGISEPAPRMTLSRILSGTFSSDTHPPGYYLLMFPWTRTVGTSLRAIRFPSAFLGLASVALLFWLGWLAGRPLSGGVAAVLLAVSGYHVFWSQVARMFALGCFLGLAATVTLLLIARGSRYRTLLSGLYVILVLGGVCTHVFFWSLFAVHMIWSLANAWGGRSLPDFCRVQFLALILGSPLIAFAAYQSANTVADLSGNVLLFLGAFLPFAFALPTANSGFFAGSVPLTGGAVFWALRAGLVLLAALLFWNALRHLRLAAEKRGTWLEAAAPTLIWKLAWLAAGVLSTAAIGGFLYMTRALPAEQIHTTIRLTKLLTILPFTLTALALLLDSIWSRLPQPGNWKRWLDGSQGLLLLLSVGPFTLLSILAQFRPILNQRGLLFASPYLLLMLSIGIVGLRAAWIYALAPVLAVLFVASSVSYQEMTVDPADYAGFAASLQSAIGPKDLVFVRKAWYATPILYYLPSEKYHLVGRDYADSCAGNPQSRVWVVLLYDSAPPDDISGALTAYRPVRTVTAPRAQAILYEPPSAPVSAVAVP